MSQNREERKILQITKWRYRDGCYIVHPHHNNIDRATTDTAHAVMSHKAAEITLKTGERDDVVGAPTPPTFCRLSPPQDFRIKVLRDMKAGMSGRPCWFPLKYCYDAEGSQICEQISETPEHYLTRAETEILRESAKEIMQLVCPDELLELGSGSSMKTRILIEAIHSTGCHRYAPLDISEIALCQAADALTADYDWLEVMGQLGDFDTDLPKLQRNGRRLVAILGSSIGNYEPPWYQRQNELSF